MSLDEYVQSLNDKSIAVIGIGVSNTPLIELLCSHGCDVTACDKRTKEQMGEEAARLKALGVKLKLGEDYLEDLHQDVIFRTPGLMPFDPHLTAAKERGSLITSEMEVFFALCPCRIIAVTGSDGKTTTTTIISELLKAAGYRVHLGGNIGHPLLCEVPEMKEDDYAVLELSSFQLHSMNCRPHVAVITNISPNHLDKHLDYQDYIDAKRSIFLQQQPEDRLILKLEDEQSAYYASAARSQICYFSDKNRTQKGTFCLGDIICRVDGETCEPILAKGDIRLPGEHNVANSLAAAATCLALGVDLDVIERTLESFTGTKRRFDIIGKTSDGVTVIDDYAHHPAEIKATLAAAKNLAHKKTWCLFQPHTYTRTMALFDQFADAFEDADIIVLAEIYAAREKNIYKMSSKKLMDEIKIKHPDKDVYFMPEFDAMAEFVCNNTSPGDIVLTMGAGDIYKVGELILEKAEK